MALAPEAFAMPSRGEASGSGALAGDGLSDLQAHEQVCGDVSARGWRS